MTDHKFRKIAPLKKAEIGVARGQPGSLQHLPVSCLVVDTGYQRDISGASTRNIQRIAREFDWTKFLPVIVVAIGGGRFAVIDGQHRSTAAATIGIERVPCYVMDCDYVAAAGAFAAINGNVTKVSAVDIWFAQVEAGEPQTLELKRVLDAADVTIVNAGSAYFETAPVGHTASVAVLRRAYAKYGGDLLTTVLQCITQTGDGNRGCIIGAVVAGIADAIRTKKDLLAEPSRLFAIFDDIDLTDVLDRARFEAKSTRSNAMSIVTRQINAAIARATEAEAIAAE